MSLLQHQFVTVTQNNPLDSAALAKWLSLGWRIYSISYRSQGQMIFDICKDL